MINVSNSKNGYGTAPVFIGALEPFEKDEMLFVQYCPVKLPGQPHAIVPDHLWGFKPFVWAVNSNLSDEQWLESYIYLTVKRLWVNADNPGNRPGWHSDGFMSDDLNYIWCDSNPTEIWCAYDPKEIWLTQDHNESLKEMDYLCNGRGKSTLGQNFHLKPNHLYKLDDKVLHRVAENFEPGIRTFVKVSVSKEAYNLKGNAINRLLPLGVPYVDRKVERNCPIGTKNEN